MVGFSEADDANSIIRLGEAQDVHSITEKTECDGACFGIFLAIIFSEDCGMKIKVRSAFKRKPSKTDVALVLGRIEGDSHEAECMYKPPQCLPDAAPAAGVPVVRPNVRVKSAPAV